MASIARFYQRGKNGAHALQALMIFIGAAVTIGIFAKSGPGDGRIRYYFALCWLCIPALIYQTAFPTFERTKGFANAYAHAVIDGLYTILWFAAFIAVIVWIRDGSHEAKDWKDGDGLCDKFAWGSTGRCKLGQATTALGGIVCALFILTFALSVYGVLYYRKTGLLPAYTTNNAQVLPGQDQDEYTFSANPYDQRDEAEPMHHERDEVSSLHTRSEGSRHQEARMSWERQRTPDLPMHQETATICWSRPPTNGSSTHEGEIIWDRQRTPDLPVGEGYYPVDTSYHGGEQTYFDTAQPHQPSSSFRRTVSPYNDYHDTHPDETVGHLRPDGHQSGANASEDVMRFSWEHEGQNGNQRVHFPDGDYHR